MSWQQMKNRRCCVLVGDAEMQHAEGTDRVKATSFETTRVCIVHNKPDPNV